LEAVIAVALKVKELNKQFGTAGPKQILSWAWSEFGPQMALMSSFGPESIVLLHLLSQAAPEMPVYFLETGFHFKETLDYKKEVTTRFNLNVVDLTSKMPRAEFKERFGEDLYRVDPDLCCEINKVEPLQRALSGVKAWASGIRRAQGPTRRDVGVIEEYENGLYKINPLTYWSNKQIWQEIKEHNLPEHPLYAQGYTSVGCWPCTRPVIEGDDERAGRWAGRVKTECGIHTFMKPAKE